jgi:hypothetical protein
LSSSPSHPCSLRASRASHRETIDTGGWGGVWVGCLGLEIDVPDVRGEGGNGERSEPLGEEIAELVRIAPDVPQAEIESKGELWSGEGEEKLSDGFASTASLFSLDEGALPVVEVAEPVGIGPETDGAIEEVGLVDDVEERRVDEAKGSGVREDDVGRSN